MTYILLGLAAGVYASLLNTPAGRIFAKERTAESTIIGTSLVLFFCAWLIPPHYLRRLILAFAVAGSPMVARSLWNRNKEATPT